MTQPLNHLQKELARELGRLYDQLDVSRAITVELLSRLDDTSCDGCLHRHWITANRYGTSSDGWGCRLSGGHAIERCVNFTTTPH